MSKKISFWVVASIVVSFTLVGCGSVVPAEDDAGVAGTAGKAGEAGAASAGSSGTAGAAAAGTSGTGGKSPTDAPPPPPGWTGTWPPVGWTYGQPLPGYDQRAQGYVLKPGYGQQTDPQAPSCVGKVNYDPCTTPRQLNPDGTITIGIGLDVPGRCFMGVCCFGCITNNDVCRQIPRNESSHFESPGLENLCGANANTCDDCNAGGSMHGCQEAVQPISSRVIVGAACLK